MTISLELKEADGSQIQKWLDFLRSLDFVHNLKEQNTEELGQSEPVFLTISAIKKEYPDKWVLLANAETDGVQIYGGYVIYSHTDKREFALNGRNLVKKYDKVRHFYTGDLPKRKHIGLIVRKQTTNV